MADVSNVRLLNSPHDCYVYMKCSASYSTAQTFETYNSLNFCEVFLELFFAGKLMIV